MDCIPIDGRDDLFLLPGHVGLAEYEVSLGLAQELSGSIQTLKNLPGAITYLLDETAERFQADYILIDMSPSLGSINQNILMTSNFFIVPTTPDFFSVMAIDSLAKILPKWHQWAKAASALPILKTANYPFPEVNLHFLGTIVQNYRIRGGQETKAFQNWINEIEKNIGDKMIPALEKNGMMLPKFIYDQNGVPDCCTLVKIPNFNSLIASSQKHQVPVFALTAEQLEWQGKVLDKAQEKQEEFKNIFSDLADKVIGLTSEIYAVSN
ncbi:Regulatory protein CII (fragment) [Microcystis aeruginosa PCC 9717]|uniref:Regulatory protein CII n=1 Tax=Microcystis aeruginosa PCC 9717 TaxID=1160286 RepID=I4FR25_MICAE